MRLLITKRFIIVNFLCLGTITQAKENILYFSMIINKDIKKWAVAHYFIGKL